MPIMIIEKNTVEAKSRVIASWLVAVKRPGIRPIRLLKSMIGKRVQTNGRYGNACSPACCTNVERIKRYILSIIYSIVDGMRYVRLRYQLVPSVIIRDVIRIDIVECVILS